MKNKKLILLISLIIILLIMAGGYAIYSSQLKVTGTGSIDSNFNIEVTDITEESKKGKAVSVTEPTYTSSTATFNTKLQRPGDSIEYEVEITNNGTVDGKINAITITNPSRVAEVETRGIAEGEIIKSGEVKTYIVRVYIPKSVKIEEDVTSVIEVNTEIVQDDNQIFNAGIDGIEANKLEIVSTKEESDYTSIKATVNAKGNGLKYYYSLDGEVWTNGITTNTYTFTGLEIGTRYTVYYKVEDENLNYVTESKWIETKDTTSPVITVSNETEWMASKEVTFTYPEIEDAEYQYKIGNGQWKEAIQNQKVEVTENTVVYAKIIYDQNEKISEKEVSKIDSGDISLELATSATTNSITVVANAEAKSGLTKYEYSVDNGETWKDNGRYNNYTFKNLVYNTTYNIKVRVTSGNGNKATKTVEVKTGEINSATFSESGTTTKTVTITYPEGCGDNLTCTYIKDSEEEVEITGNTVNVEFNNDGTIIAKVSDGKNEVSNTYNVVVDRTVTYDYRTNGGSSATKTSEVVAVSSSVDLSPTATKSGWTFVGWNTNKDATSALSSYSMPASNVTLYAIYRKEAITLTAKFNANGASLSSTANKTCTLNEVYNNSTQSTSCTVDAPTITREGYSKIGYNTSASSTSNNSSYNVSTGKLILTSSNTGSTWYAITSKVVTITFNKNGASTQTNASGTAVSDSSVTRTCTMYNTDASCSVTSPQVVGASGFSVVGYNTSASAQTSTWNHNTSKTVSANETYNAITKKDGKTYTVTFYKNGAASQTNASGTAVTTDTVTRSCDIATVYNGASQATTCSVTSPEIVGSTNTPTVVGYGTSSTAQTSSWSHNTAKDISANASYYAVTKKDGKTITITFNKNGASTQTNSSGTAVSDASVTRSCDIATVYNGATQEATCTITSPTIVGASGFSVVGYNTSASAQTSTWNHNTSKTVSANETYNAITKKDGRTITISYSKGTGISSIGATSNSCTIAAVYNGATQAETCSVTLPTITTATEYTANGWYSGSTKIGNAGASVNVSANATYTATASDTVKPTVTLSPTSQSSYVSGGKAVTLTLKDAGSGLKASQNIYYAWSTSSSSAPSYSSYVTSTNSAGATSATVTVPASASSGLTGTYYLWVKVGTLSDVSNNTNLVATSSAFKFDNTDPNLSVSTSKTSKSITVVANASAESGITKYEYSKDGGSNWTTGTSNTYTFDNLDDGETYSIRVRVTSGVNKTATSTSTSVTTTTLSVPTFSVSGSTTKTVTITYPSGCGSTYVCTYVKDGGSAVNVKSTTAQVEFTNDGTLIATVSDNKNEVSATYNVTTAKIVTYNYSTNGGTSSTKASAEVETGVSVDLSPTASKSGWTFVGWNTNKDATSALSSYSMPANNVTLYAIYRKEAVTLTAKFNANGAELSSTTDKTCTLSAVYNNNTQDTSCTVDAPVVTREGYSKIGYNTSASSTSNNSNYNVSTGKLTLTSSNTGSTWYAITSKVVTITFNKNGASTQTNASGTAVSDSSVTRTCTMYNTDASCSVTSPQVVAASGFSVVGYNTSSSAQTSTWSHNTAKSVSANETYNAITKKDGKTYTVTFYKNGAASQTNASGTAVTTDTVTRSCDIATVYNGASQATSCSITSPTIVGSSNTPTVVGYGTSSNAQTSTWNHNTAKDISANASYYAVTKKDGKTITITFNKNGASTQTNASGTAVTTDTVTRSCDIATVYNGASQATSCSITSPTIVGSSNTPTVVGYNTSASAQTSTWNHNTSKTVSANETYNAITKKDGKTITISYSKGTGVSSIGATSNSCTIAAVYNGATQAETCSVTLPTITTATEYTANGWYSGTTKIGDAGDSINVSANATYTATASDTVKPTVTLSPNSQSTYVSGGKAVTLTLNDAGSGLKASQNIYYAWSTSNSSAPSYSSYVTSTNSAGAASATVTVPASSSSSLTGTYYLWIKVGTLSDVSNNTSLVATSSAFKFDNTDPSLSVSTSKTSKSITVIANASAESGITKYEYSKDDGQTWIDGGSYNSYTFEGLFHNSEYHIKVRVTNRVGLQTEKTEILTTDYIALPVFKEETDIVDAEGNLEVSVTITYPEGCGDKYTCSYELKDGTEVVVEDRIKVLVFTTSGGDNTIIAKVTDGTNYITSSAYTVVTVREYNYDAIGAETYVVSKDGYYKIELWGANGGIHSTSYEGKGAYTSGEIYLEKGDTLFFYNGEEGVDANNCLSDLVFNGGGMTLSNNNACGPSGGGATDVRLVSGQWNNENSLRSRIMVAAGGAAMADGGDLIGREGYTTDYEYYASIGKRATQTSGGETPTLDTCTTSNGTAGGFGYGGNGGASGPSVETSGGSGGGSGYYGGSGASGLCNGTFPGGSGSSYISGYAGVNSITSETSGTHTNGTKHYSGKYFINTEMRSGVNDSNGKSKISFIGTPSSEDSKKILGVRYIKDCMNGSLTNSYNHWVEIEAINKGINVAKGKTVTGTSDVTGDTQPLSAIVDGKMDNASLYAHLPPGNQCIIVDLGQEYDLEEIATWHYYNDGRTYYENITSVAGDSGLYREIYNGERVETSNGNHIKTDNLTPAIKGVQESGRTTVTISFPGGCSDTYTCSYIKNEGEEVIVTENSVTLEFIETGTVTAKVTRDSEYIASSTYTAIVILEYEYNYLTSQQVFTPPKEGYYKVETWGASGGQYSSYSSGKGAYASGEIYLETGDNLYIYTGGQGTVGVSATGGYNGGGQAGTTSSNGSGGGSTDIRYNDTSLNARIMVAAGGGGSASYSSYYGYGGNGGDLIGGEGTSTYDSARRGGGGTQTSTTRFYSGIPASFGSGGGRDLTANVYTGGGGSGYYGGNAGGDYGAGGGGGSSFISGYAGVNAISSVSEISHTNGTNHYSGKYFINTELQAGVNSGNGKAKITFIDKPTKEDSKKILNVRYIKDCTNGNSYNTGNHWVEIEAINKGVNVAKGKNVTGTSAETNNTTYAYANVVDGKIDNITGSSGFGYSSEDGNQCLIVDLEKEYNLEEIGIWHYYLDNRTYYENTTSVAGSDGNYRTIYGGSKEATSNGNHIKNNEATSMIGLTPTFSESGGTTSKTVTITYPSGCGSVLSCSYSKDSGSAVTVTSSTVSVAFTNNGKIIAKVTKGDGTVSSEYKVTGINPVTLEISGYSSFGNFQVPTWCASSGPWTKSQYTFNITATGSAVSSGTLCYYSYCKSYASSGSTGYGWACFNSASVWTYYRAGDWVTATVCNAAGTCKSAEVLGGS